jgi:tRNA nucleotidyltransferase (CCA-adding enzyme)
MNKMDYETFEHEADIGVRGFGNTLGEAFENAAKSMFSIMYDLKQIAPRETAMITCQAPDKETLFVEWLNELLAQASLREMAFSKFNVEEISDEELKGSAMGEKVDLKKHTVKVEVKGATYSMLEIRKNKRYIAQCIVDV